MKMVLKEIPVQILELGKGDVLVLRPECATQEMIQGLTVYIHSQFVTVGQYPPVVLVISRDVDLALVKAKAE